MAELLVAEDTDMDCPEIRAYIVGDDADEVVEADPLLDLVVSLSKGPATSQSPDTYVDVLKSTTSMSKQLPDNAYPVSSFSLSNLMPAPYNPELMVMFMSIDEIVHRAILAKTQDSVGSAFRITPKPSGNTAEVGTLNPKNTRVKNRAAVTTEAKIAENFITYCNDSIGFQGVLQRACMDLECVGWAAIEVIRGADMKIRQLDVIPAGRIRVAANYEFFVEQFGGRIRYYQPFGKKVLSKTRRNPNLDQYEMYNPDEDGPLGPSSADWSLIDQTTGQPTKNFKDSATEVLWLQKFHPSTIYYGISDSLPAKAQILGGMYIKQYLLQYFEHNTVPRYAIIIKGANLSPEVKEAIMNYFTTHVKGRAHKTLVIPIPTTRGNVEVKFEKLDVATEKEFFGKTSLDLAHGVGRAHGVPSAILGFDEAASLGSGKGTAQNQVYKDRIVTPLQAKFKTAVDKLFSLGLGLTRVHGSFNPLDIRDREAEARTLGNLFDRGSVTVNQIIELLGLGNPVSGGDRPFIKLGNQLVFIDQLPELTSGNLPAPPAPVNSTETRGARGVPKTPNGLTPPGKPPGNTVENVQASQLSKQT